MKSLIDEVLTEELKGKTFDQVKETYSKVRIMREDGVGRCGTCDFRPERINLHLDNGLVVGAYKG